MLPVRATRSASASRGQGQQLLVVGYRIDVAQGVRIIDLDLENLLLVPGKQLSAALVAGDHRQLGKKSSGDENRAAAPSAMPGYDDRRIGHAEGLDQPVDEGRGDQGLVCRYEDRGLDSGLEVGQATAYRGALAAGEIAVVDELDGETGEHRGKRRSAMADDHQNLAELRGESGAGNSPHQWLALEGHELLWSTVVESPRRSSCQDDAGDCGRPLCRRPLLRRRAHPLGLGGPTSMHVVTRGVPS